MDLHRKTIEVMERHESRQQAAWQHRNADIDAENCLNDHEGQEDPNAHCLGEGLNVSHRNINYTTYAAVIAVAMSMIALIFWVASTLERGY